MTKIGLEVCVDSPAGLAAAVRGGASRIELCSALALSGVTPSPGFMRLAARSGVPAYPMIRPHAGPYHYDRDDLFVMRRDMQTAKEAGLTGVVIGANLADGRLDLETLKPLCDHARGLGLQLTLHRAFDLTPDQSEALEAAIALGFERVLTSGGAQTAPQGVQAITGLVRQAAGRISVMPGSGLTPENLANLMRSSGAAEAHGSCGRSVAARPLAPDVAVKAQALGFISPKDRETDEDVVRRMVLILSDIAKERRAG